MLHTLPALRCTMVCFAAMLQQPRVPPTGQRQAVEIQIKWREVLAQKQAYLKILSQTTGHSQDKLDKVCHRLVNPYQIGQAQACSMPVPCYAMCWKSRAMMLNMMSCGSVPYH